MLNEQYMVSAHAPPAGGDGLPSRSEVLTNKVIKFLCFKGDDFKTFGENIILLLNRESMCISLMKFSFWYYLRIRS